MDIKQSTARIRVFSFLGVSLTSLSVTISKNGNSFGAVSGAGLAQITGNFYKVTLNATDTDTLGDLAYKFSDTVLGVIAPQGEDVDQVLVDLPGGAVASVAAGVTLANGVLHGGDTASAQFTTITSDFTGDIIGDITGSVAGTVGGVSGSIVGNLQGNVTGDIEGTVFGNVIVGGGNVNGVIGLVTRGESLDDFVFQMTDSTSHAPVPGKTVTATVSLDGGSYAACGNSVVEIANGMYKIDLASEDTNGRVVALRFTATGADDLNITIIAQGGGG